jgi:hypothetical protein
LVKVSLGEAVFNSPPAAGGSGRGDVGLVVPDDHGGDGFEGAAQVRQEVGGVRIVSDYLHEIDLVVPYSNTW